MAKYYLTASFPVGKRTTQAVEAQSLADARQALLDQGCTDIVVHNDDVMTINQVDAPNNPFSPEEMTRLGSMTQLQLTLLIIKKLLPILLPMVLIGAAALALGIMWHRWLLMTIGSFGLAFPVVLAIYSLRINLDKSRYEALLRAASWWRWDEVERLLRIRGLRLPPEERAFREAQLLAVRGDIQAALRSYDASVSNLHVPDWSVSTRHAVLYLMADIASRTDGAVTESSQPRESPLIDAMICAYERAVEQAPDQAVTSMALAMALVRFRRDVRRARQLLEASKGVPAAEAMIAFQDYVQGVLALEENAPEQAIERILAFQASYRKFATGAVLDATLDQSRAYLSLAYAMAGREELAMQQFRLCEPRLAAVHEVELLARCRHALGLNPC